MRHEPIGALVLGIAALLGIVGAVIYFFGDKLKWIGHLPGDISYRNGNFSFYFPLTTLVLMNGIVWLLIRIFSGKSE